MTHPAVPFAYVQGAAPRNDGNYPRLAFIICQSLSVILAVVLVWKRGLHMIVSHLSLGVVLVLRRCVTLVATALGLVAHTLFWQRSTLVQKFFAARMSMGGLVAKLFREKQKKTRPAGRVFRDQAFSLLA
ncbi:MAG: hypothetical protein ACNA7L_03930, partial [Roseinatronobacter sp.]